MASGKKVTNEEFIRRARLVHGDRFDYSLVNLVDMRTNVDIVCPEHGIFHPLPKHFLAGGNCPECARLSKKYCKKLTTEEFIARARGVHGGAYSYDHTIYQGMNKRIVVTCPVHGDVTVNPAWFLAGSGCRFCGMDSKKRLIEGFGINDLIAESKSVYVEKWRALLKRCLNERELQKHPTYRGCTIDPRWKYASAFKKWYEENYYDGAEEIDKDILSSGRSKVYGPATCLLVPKRINALLIGMGKKNKSGYIGVHRSYGRKFEAHGCFSDSGKSTSFGSFNTEIEAFLAYKKRKEDFIKLMADKFFSEGLISKKVYDALYKYEVINPQ